MSSIRKLPALAAVLLAFAFPPAFAAAPVQSDALLRINSAARLIAGLTPTHPDQMALAQREEWSKHSAKMQASWVRLRGEQAAALMEWRNAVLPRGCPVRQTLLYPFSGPDFFNVYWLFPNCEKYVLFGLEPIGKVPAVEQMSKEHFARLMLGVREVMANLFARDYFITSHMATHLKRDELKGVVPIIMIAMALAGVEITRIEPHVLDPAKPAAPSGSARQDPAARPPHELKGVTIEFRQPGSQNVQTLHYFSVDVSNKGLRHYPEFAKYLRDLGPTATLVKAASYLMHIDQFTRIRDLLLDSSEFLVQDDTGVPYAELAKRGWTLRVYGRYQEPIPPFERHYQRPLANEYDIQKPKQLMFHFGYRRGGDGNERSNVIVGIRAVPLEIPDADDDEFLFVASGQDW